VLKAVQCGLPRQHSAIGAARFRLARDKAENRIVAQFLVIVQVLVAKGDPMNALGEERLDAVFDPVLPAAVCEAGRRLPCQSDGAIGLAQQQSPCVRGDGAAVKSRCDLPPAEAGEIEGIQATLCRHRRGLLRQENPLWQKNFR
jgi:hypothetical protein